ncbi:MAG: hypothetical protein HY062_01960 [Bacteroidetes bacterium]|nr:hypothetical protein [Bacteroidota bacterium]
MIRQFIIGSFFTIVITAVVSCHGKEIKEQLNEQSEETVELKNYTEEKVTVQEFVTWCADKNNKLNKSKDIADIRFDLSYRPAPCMAYLELRTETYDFPKFQEACNHYYDMSYFNFRLEVIDGTGELLKYKLQSPAQYEERVKYTSFEMQKDIYLVQGNDTLLPGLFHFERIFEVAPYSTVMLAFDNKKFNKDSEFTIIYNDKLFEKGFVKFNYKNKQLINLPNISGL